MNPAADLDLGAVADVPMCEFWHKEYGFNTSFSCIEAASVAHVLGRPVVAAEAFTSWGGFHSYPGNLKNQGDWAFCVGVNNFYYHTFAHKPFDDRYRPGMTMGPYGVHWDRGEPWWPMASAYHTVHRSVLISPPAGENDKPSCCTSPLKALLTCSGLLRRPRAVKVSPGQARIQL